MATRKILLVPGLFNSGPDHWQSHWERTLSNIERVHQRDYDNPVCSEWIDTIQKAVEQNGDDVVLVGHSSGSIAIPHWARKFKGRVAGAMLVGPSDVEQPDFPYQAAGFKPVPLDPLPFPSIVVASSEDPYVSLDRATYFASNWGSKLVNIGAAGHINTLSGHGPWPEGLEILKELL
jgi:predicted alpha/beta hydrolase family esterase